MRLNKGMLIWMERRLIGVDVVLGYHCVQLRGQEHPRVGHVQAHRRADIQAGARPVLDHGRALRGQPAGCWPRQVRARPSTHCPSGTLFKETHPLGHVKELQSTVHLYGAVKALFPLYRGAIVYCIMSRPQQPFLWALARRLSTTLGCGHGILPS